MKVLLIDTNHERIKTGLEALGMECVEGYHLSKIEIEKIIDQFDGIIIRSRFSIDQYFLDKAKQLKFIGRVGAGLENIDQAYAEQKNIKLISAPEGNMNAVGEHALGMLLSLMNRLKIADLEVRNGIWKREENRGLEIEGKTVGIIGYGNMGKSFAKKLQGFDCEIIFHDIIPNIEDQNARQVSLSELFERTDILSLHTPQTALTKGMINSKFINQFKKPIFIINTARGSAIVTKDLVKAIEQQKILGAGLDVLEYEKTSFENLFSNDSNMPEAFKYLIKSDKVLLSPHIAGWTVESKFKLADTIVKKVEQHFN